MANNADSFYQKTKVAVEEGRLDEALQSIRVQKSPVNSKTRELISTLANALAHRADRHVRMMFSSPLRLRRPRQDQPTAPSTSRMLSVLPYS